MSHRLEKKKECGMCGLSLAVYSCAQGAPLNFDDLTFFPFQIIFPFFVQAFQAQKFRELQEQERRRHIEEHRNRDMDKRLQVEDRRREIERAEQERREAILSRNKVRYPVLVDPKLLIPDPTVEKIRIPIRTIISKKIVLFFSIILSF
jgi:hypothetical protein